MNPPSFHVFSFFAAMRYTVFAAVFAAFSIVLPSCNTGANPESGTETGIYTVTFDAGNGTENTAQQIADGSTAEEPDPPVKENHRFEGWYRDTSFENKWNFTADIVTGSITLYAKWIIIITNTNDVGSYLADNAGTLSKPAPLLVRIDLGIMTEAESGWRRLLAAIEDAKKYVELDLSACTMNGDTFNPVPSEAAGKKRIVSITLPDTAKTISDDKDSSNDIFKSFTVLTSFSGNGLISIGDNTFRNCDSLTQLSLPVVTSIGNSAFYNCTRLSLTALPAELTSIGNYAFYNCDNLTLTALPAGISSISSYVFSDCENLALTALPTGLISIGSRAFESCTRIALTALPEELTFIGEGAFYNCEKLALTLLPQKLTSIAASVFYSCYSLELTALPEELKSIGNYAFHSCKNLTLSSLPRNLTIIGDGAFYNCTRLALTALPEELMSIGDNAFYGCENLIRISPLAATSIGKNAFSNCTRLEKISLPQWLLSIGDNTFGGCTNLAEVICNAETPPALGTDVFTNTHSSLAITVPAASVAVYRLAGGWKNYVDNITAQ